MSTVECLGFETRGMLEFTEEMVLRFDYSRTVSDILLMRPPNMSRVAVIGTGGSISIVGRHSLDLFEYDDFGRVLEVDELLTRIPEVKVEAEVIPVRFRALRSTAVGPQDWLQLNDLVHHVALTHAPLSGIVITHGQPRSKRPLTS